MRGPERVRHRRYVAVERRLRGRHHLVLGDADASDRAARAGGADRGRSRLLGADAFEHRVSAEAARQLADSLDGLVVPLRDVSAFPAPVFSISVAGQDSGRIQESESPC